MKRAVALAAAFAALLPGLARAEVRELADRLAEAWKASGQAVLRVPARFIYEDETVTMSLPPAPGKCIAVAIIGPRGLSFHARTGSGTEDDPLDDSIERGSSIAGAMEIGRCGSADFSRLRLTSDAGRGAVEVVVASGDKLAPALKSVIPERAGSIPIPSLEPGGPPPLAPPPKRADAADARARAERAVLVARDAFAAGDDGTGTQSLALAAGCHRFELFGNDARVNARKRLDLDAELREDTSDAPLARDRSEAADARLETCVGEPTDVHLVVSGAGPQGTVLVVHASWPIPEKLPFAWGPPARARMAEGLIARHVLAPTQPAVLLLQGATGNTGWVQSIEPGGCYMAIAAVAQGIPRGIGLRAVLGAREVTDDRGPTDQSALVAFCAAGRDSVRFEIEARGPGISWGLALFRVASGAWEAR
jgi:hypothetical protein